MFDHELNESLEPPVELEAYEKEDKASVGDITRALVTSGILIKQVLTPACHSPHRTPGRRPVLAALYPE